MLFSFCEFPQIIDSRLYFEYFAAALWSAEKASREARAFFRRVWSVRDSRIRPFGPVCQDQQIQGQFPGHKSWQIPPVKARSGPILFSVRKRFGKSRIELRRSLRSETF